MSKLVMMVGVSGSGKSTMARNLMESGEIDEIVSSDEMRIKLFGDVNEQRYNNKVFEEVHREIKRLLKEGKNVCYDATNLSCKRRIKFLKTLADLDIEKECIVVLASLEDCLKRQYERERKVPEGVIINQIKQFQCPYYYEGWNSIEVCHTSHVSLLWFMERNKIPHDNPHHEENIYDHMIKAESIYKAHYDDIGKHCAREAVRYHDVGKYFCKQFTLSNGLPDSVAHYYNHQNASAYFYLLDYNNFAMNGLADALYTAILIQWHMEFWTREEKGMEKLAEMLGPKMMEELKELHACDELAH